MLCSRWSKISSFQIPNLTHILFSSLIRSERLCSSPLALLSIANKRPFYPHTILSPQKVQSPNNLVCHSHHISVTQGERRQTPDSPAYTYIDSPFLFLPTPALKAPLSAQIHDSSPSFARPLEIGGFGSSLYCVSCFSLVRDGDVAASFSRGLHLVQVRKTCQLVPACAHLVRHRDSGGEIFVVDVRGVEVWVEGLGKGGEGRKGTDLDPFAYPGFYRGPD